MTRPWRVIAPDGTIIEMSSTFSEAEIVLRDGDSLQHLDWQNEWRAVAGGEPCAESVRTVEA